MATPRTIARREATNFFIAAWMIAAWMIEDRKGFSRAYLHA
jgi:hypothetical protein